MVIEVNSLFMQGFYAGVFFFPASFFSVQGKELPLDFLPEQGKLNTLPRDALGNFLLDRGQADFAFRRMSG